MLEKDIQRQILEYLSLRKGILFWRNNSIPVFDRHSGKFRSMGKYALNGLPDVIALSGGTAYGIEVKGPSGRLSEAQKGIMESWRHAGGVYIIARSLDDVSRIL